MGVKSDRWVIDRCRAEPSMIEPFVEELVREEGGRKVISYGPSSYGYDIRCSHEFMVFRPKCGGVVDPKGIDEGAFDEVTVQDGGFVLIPPNSFALARSVEYLRIPRDVLVFAAPKSSYARTGLCVPTTILEPSWEGHLTIEISNTTPLWGRCYAGEGICQLVFIGADFEMTDDSLLAPMDEMRGGSAAGIVRLQRRVCETSYADRAGKYQGQTGITLPGA
jgi:dCTP deaminase